MSSPENLKQKIDILERKINNAKNQLNLAKVALKKHNILEAQDHYERAIRALTLRC